MGRVLERACKIIKDKYKPRWYTYLPTSEYLKEEDKLFLNYYSGMGEFQKCFPRYFLATANGPLYLYNSLEVLKNWIKTGELIYIPCPFKVKAEMMVKR